MMLMEKPVFYLPLATAVMRRVRQRLIDSGADVSESPSPDVTHLILGVPSLESDGSLKNGGSLPDILNALPRDITIIGGNLNHPVLNGFEKIDLLKIESFLWRNAAITADCALSLARQRMSCCWQDANVLILGFGRIGFHLAWTLGCLNTKVTVAARKHTALAQAESMGMDSILIDAVDPDPFTVIFNTVPHMVLPEDRCKNCTPNCIKMDLASAPGIGGSGVIWARGLPGKYAPESAGNLIAKTIIQEVCS